MDTSLTRSDSAALYASAGATMYCAQEILLLNLCRDNAHWYWTELSNPTC